jgi:PmbA protein
LSVGGSGADELFATAERCVATARAGGAREAAARAYKVRDVGVQWRDGAVEKIGEATTRGVGVQLYVDGRYAALTSSDLRPESLERFVADGIAMTRSLAPDPHRSLPDPALYAGQPAVDLELEDPAYAAVLPEERRRVAEEIESGARAVPGADAILSVTTAWSDTRAESARVHSNGFRGARADTSFWISASVSVKDDDGRRPEDYAVAGARFRRELPAAATVGRDAALRALARRRAKKSESAVLSMAVENRAAGRLVGFLLGPLAAQALQQKRSFLEGRVGSRVGSTALSLTDDPLVPKGFGSRLYDGEGIAARRLPLFEDGVLRSYYVDTYYGKKLGLPPTTAAASNLAWRLGDRGKDALLAAMVEGILVTGFLGGNSNGTTGDFSLGVQGYRVRDGRAAEPVAEMNIAGNHLELWKRLVAVGDDPYAYSAMRTPTLVFEGVQFAGI